MCDKDAMVDRAARDRAAELIRHLASGQITNDEFEDALPETSDSAVSEVFRHGAWFLYSDTSEYRLTGKDALPRKVRPDIARWLLFLKSDLEYEWPIQPAWGCLVYPILNVLTLGCFACLSRMDWAQRGHADVWPFIRRADYEEALKHPPYLAGEHGMADEGNV